MSHFTSSALARSTALAAVAAGLLTAPGAAQAETICVAPATGCDTQFGAGQLAQALSTAGSMSTSDTVRLGAATYTGPFTYSGGANSGVDSIVGAGRDQTTVTAVTDSSKQVLRVMADQANGRNTSVRDLKVVVPAGAQGGWDGLVVQHASARNVDVVANTASNASGVTVDDANFAGGQVVASSRAVYVSGDAAVTDAALKGDNGVGMSAPGKTATVSRSRIAGNNTGVAAESGTLNVDDSVVDLGAGNFAIGALAQNYNAGTPPKALNLRHVTMVGGGTDSVGVQVGSTNKNAAQFSTATVADSVIAGPAVPIRRMAGNAGGGIGLSTASVTTRHSSYRAADNESANTFNGSGAITEETPALNVAPGFVNAAAGDYRLAAGSPLVDAGNPAAAGPTLDLASGARVQDGNGDGVARRDIGAYEYVVPAPVQGNTDAKTEPIKGDSLPRAQRDLTAPVLTTLGLARKTLLRRRSATVRLSVSEAATVKLTVARKASRAKKAKRWTTLRGAVTVKLAAGKRTLTYRGTRSLAPGRYRLTARATDAAGNVSKARTVDFRVIRAGR